MTNVEINNEVIHILEDSAQALAHALERLKDDGQFSTSIALKYAMERASSMAERIKLERAVENLQQKVKEQQAWMTKAAQSMSEDAAIIHHIRVGIPQLMSYYGGVYLNREEVFDLLRKAGIDLPK